MGGDKPPSEESTPGFRTVWRAPDVGPEQAVTCPRCHVAIGTVGERGKAQLFCTRCQTVYRAEGRAGAPPAVESIGQRVVIEGENKLAQMVQGGFPEVRPWWFSVGAQVLLWAALLGALALLLCL